jgi:hypothetical protein
MATHSDFWVAATTVAPVFALSGMLAAHRYRGWYFRIRFVAQRNAADRLLDQSNLATTLAAREQFYRQMRMAAPRLDDEEMAVLQTIRAGRPSRMENRPWRMLMYSTVAVLSLLAATAIGLVSLARTPTPHPHGSKRF